MFIDLLIFNVKIYFNINLKDASKMNRVLFIARVDPDEEDLKLTARSILKSYYEEKDVYKKPSDI